MSTQVHDRINARTIVLSAPRHETGGPDDGASPPAALCANPNCTNLVTETWEQSGTLCGRCAIEEDLFDREARRDRSFGLDVF